MVILWCRAWVTKRVIPKAQVFCYLTPISKSKEGMDSLLCEYLKNYWEDGYDFFVS
jgi:hypothetical protein